MTKAYDRSVRSNQEPLTLDQLRYYTPAALATAPWHEVSTRYSPISTIDIIDGLAKEGFGLSQAMQQDSRIKGKSGFTKHQLTFRRLDQFGKAGAVHGEVPEVNIINDYSASAAFQGMAALFRYICSNGLTLVDTASDIFRVCHTGKVDDVVSATLAIANNMETKLAQIEQMKHIFLNEKERFYLASQVMSVRYPGAKAEETHFPKQLLIPAQYDSGLLDLWHTYNLVQYRAIKGGTYVRGYAHDKGRKVTSLDNQLKINLAAWQAAQELRVRHS
jgi:hypothetical protein